MRVFLLNVQFGIYKQECISIVIYIYIYIYISFRSPYIYKYTHTEFNLANLEVHVSDVCSSCYSRGGLCEVDNKGKFHCTITEKGIEIGITQKFLVLHTYIENAYRFLCV